MGSLTSKCGRTALRGGKRRKRIMKNRRGFVDVMTILRWVFQKYLSMWWIGWGNLKVEKTGDPLHHGIEPVLLRHAAVSCHIVLLVWHCEYLATSVLYLQDMELVLLVIHPRIIMDAGWDESKNTSVSRHAFCTPQHVTKHSISISSKNATRMSNASRKPCIHLKSDVTNNWTSILLLPLFSIDGSAAIELENPVRL